MEAALSAAARGREERAGGWVGLFDRSVAEGEEFTAYSFPRAAAGGDDKGRSGSGIVASAAAASTRPVAEVGARMTGVRGLLSAFPGLMEALAGAPSEVLRLRDEESGRALAATSIPLAPALDLVLVLPGAAWDGAVAGAARALRDTIRVVRGGLNAAELRRVGQGGRGEALDAFFRRCLASLAPHPDALSARSSLTAAERRDLLELQTGATPWLVPELGLGDELGMELAALETSAAPEELSGAVRHALPVGAALFLRGRAVSSSMRPAALREVALACRHLGLLRRDPDLPATAGWSRVHADGGPAVLTAAAMGPHLLCLLLDEGAGRPPRGAPDPYRVQLSQDYLLGLYERGLLSRLADEEERDARRVVSAGRFDPAAAEAPAATMAERLRRQLSSSSLASSSSAPAHAHAAAGDGVGGVLLDYVAVQGGETGVLLTAQARGFGTAAPDPLDEAVRAEFSERAAGVLAALAQPGAPDELGVRVEAAGVPVWVAGRRLAAGAACVVCYHESVPQHVVDVAFDLLGQC